MKNRRRDIFEEPGYWQSYSDMMAALLLIFILLIAITLFVYRQKRTDLEQAQLQLNETRQELEASEVELKNSMRELEDAYAKATMTEDELATAYQKIDEAQAELDSTRSELQDIVGIRTDIIGELQKRFDNSSMKVDAQTGTITFSSDVLFRYNSALLTTESKEKIGRAHV